MPRVEQIHPANMLELPGSVQPGGNLSIGTAGSEADENSESIPVKHMQQERLVRRSFEVKQRAKRESAKTTRNDSIIVDLSGAGDSLQPYPKQQAWEGSSADKEDLEVKKGRQNERPIVVHSLEDLGIKPKKQNKAKILMTKLKQTIFGADSKPNQPHAKYSVDDDLPREQTVTGIDAILKAEEHALESGKPPKKIKKKKKERLNSDQIADLLLQSAEEALRIEQEKRIEKVLTARERERLEGNNDEIEEDKVQKITKKKKAKGRKKKKHKEADKVKSPKGWYTLEHLRHAMQVANFDYTTEEVGMIEPYSIEEGCKELIGALQLDTFRKTTKPVRRAIIDDWRTKGIFASRKKAHAQHRRKSAESGFSAHSDSVLNSRRSLQGTQDSPKRRKSKKRV